MPVSCCSQDDVRGLLVGGTLTGPVAVLEVVRPTDLEALRVPIPGAANAFRGTKASELQKGVTADEYECDT